MTYEQFVDGNAALKEEPVGTARVSKAIEQTFRDLYEDYMEPVSRFSADLPTKFFMLKNEWAAQTAFLSSIIDKSMHPAYQKIIGMGDQVVPFIFAELMRKPGHWFWALKAITGADPVMPEHRGRVKQMTDDWLNWGKEKGYIF